MFTISFASLTIQDWADAIAESVSDSKTTVNNIFTATFSVVVLVRLSCRWCDWGGGVLADPP